MEDALLPTTANAHNCIVHPYRIPGDAPRIEHASSRSSDWLEWVLFVLFILGASRVAVAWARGERFGFEVAIASVIVAVGVDRKLRSLGRSGLDRGLDLDD